jgi:hypothetical protein
VDSRLAPGAAPDLGGPWRSAGSASRRSSRAACGTGRWPCRRDHTPFYHDGSERPIPRPKDPDEQTWC